MAVAQVNNPLDGKLLEELRAAYMGDEALFQKAVTELNSLLEKEKRACSVSIGAQLLNAAASDGHNFKGDAPSDIDAGGTGALASWDLATLYKSTTAYTFTPGGVLDTIEFKSDGSAVLGTWKGKLNPGVARPFTYPGQWS